MSDRQPSRHETRPVLMTDDAVHPLVERDQIVIMPGVYDGLSAKLADRPAFLLSCSPGSAWPPPTWANPMSGC